MLTFIALYVSSSCFIERLRNHVITLIALFTTVHLQMFPQIACPRRGIVTLVAFV